MGRGGSGTPVPPYAISIEDLAVAARLRGLERRRDLAEGKLRGDHGPRVDPARGHQAQDVRIDPHAGVSLGEHEDRALDLQRFRVDLDARRVAADDDNLAEERSRRAPWRAACATNAPAASTCRSAPEAFGLGHDDLLRPDGRRVVGRVGAHLERQGAARCRHLEHQDLRRRRRRAGARPRRGRSGRRRGPPRRRRAGSRRPRCRARYRRR